MAVEVRVSTTDQATNHQSLVLSRKVVDGPVVIAVIGANGQQLSTTVDPVELFHCIRAIYPELTIQ